MGSTSVTEIEQRTLRKVVRRLVPFLMLCYLLAFTDRDNVGMALLQMNHDLGLAARVFRFGSSLLFVPYFFFEVPSNLALQRHDACIWIAWIIIMWGLILAATTLVSSSASLYALRFLLDAAEAGFFLGVLLYLSYWILATHRARIVATFMVAIPAASLIGSPISAVPLQMNGFAGLRGWHWLFTLEGTPTTSLGITHLRVLTNRPEEVKWLSNEERQWLTDTLADGARGPGKAAQMPLFKLFCNRYASYLALVDMCVSTAGGTLSVWQPQLLKSFGLTVTQTGLPNSVSYAVASMLVVVWGRRSDRLKEHHRCTTIPMLLIGLGLLGTSLSGPLVPTMMMLCVVLVGAYPFKGPFRALAFGMFPNSVATAGLTTINAIASLIGGGLMVSVYDWVKQAIGSYALALMPLALLTLVSVTTLLPPSRAKPEAQVLNKMETA